MRVRQIKSAFDRYVVTLPVSNIVSQHEVSSATKQSSCYQQIASSLEHVGLIEPLVVYEHNNGLFLLVDGHSRLDILKSRGAEEVRCILARDDEAYTYNKRVNHVPPIAQHFMLLEVLKNGVPEERVAAALNVDIRTIRDRRDLLNGICPEAVELLHDRRVSAQVFGLLRKMKPLRQIEAAEHMIASNTFNILFARAILAVTKQEMLNMPARRKGPDAKMVASQTLLAKESESLLSDLKTVEESYGSDVLALKISVGYLERLFANSRVEKYLEKNHADTFRALRSLLADTPVVNS